MARRKNPYAVGLARLRMKRMTAAERQAVARLGGQARTASTTPEERSAIARKGAEALSPEQRQAKARAAAKARWAKAKGQTSGPSAGT
jgi:hypothetical protein